MGYPDKNHADYVISCPMFVNTCVKKAITTTTSRAGPLDPGLHRIISVNACHIRQGASNVEAAVDDYYLASRYANNIYVTGDGDDYIAGITDSGSATLYISRRDPL